MPEDSPVHCSRSVSVRTGLHSRAFLRTFGILTCRRLIAGTAGPYRASVLFRAALYCAYCSLDAALILEIGRSCVREVDRLAQHVRQNVPAQKRNAARRLLLDCLRLHWCCCCNTSLLLFNVRSYELPVTQRVHPRIVHLAVKTQSHGCTGAEEAVAEPTGNKNEQFGNRLEEEVLMYAN